MAHYKLSTVLAELVKSLNRTEQLAVAAYQWSMAAFPKGVPKFSVHHKEIVTELVFLRAFLTWEAFLEESFTLYLLGKRPPRGNPPHRYVCPQTRKVAEQLIVPEGWEYVDWTAVSKVVDRAERFFRDGKPYSSVLRAQQYGFDEMKTIRNAIVHSSSHSWEKFKSLARSKLGTYSHNLTIGGFLTMTVPGSSPPESFFESYLSRIRFAAERIVPR
jgi:hypothetical protein